MSREMAKRKIFLRGHRSEFCLGMTARPSDCVYLLRSGLVALGRTWFAHVQTPTTRKGEKVRTEEAPRPANIRLLCVVYIVIGMRRGDFAVNKRSLQSI